MNLFQILALAVLGTLLFQELMRLARGGRGRGIWLVRCVVWSAAALAIARPDLVQGVASALHIGRGADMVLYLFVLTFPVVVFALYSRFVRLRGQVTELVRHIAVMEARRGAGDGPDAMSKGPA